ncbi:MAG TPA: polysaccharide biosynthesis tyrosine autokinase [Pirellulales bacterium]|nr:polysaccharide biosynthesis tyrosine autokinase [Pirellulales bacterium]
MSANRMKAEAAVEDRGLQHIEAGYATGKVDVVAAISRRKWLLLLAVAITTSLGAVYYTQKRPTYESSSRILVKNNEVQYPLMDASAGLRQQEKLNTQMILIRSPLIAQLAIERHDLADLQSMAEQADLIKYMLKNLSVARADKQADALDLSFNSTSPEDAATVLNAIIESYKFYLGETQHNISKETLSLITEAKDVLLQQLEEKEAAYREFRRQSPLLWKGRERTNLHQERLGQIERGRAETLLEISDLEAQLAGVKDAVTRGEHREALMMMLDRHLAMRYAGGKDSIRLEAFPDQLLPLLSEEQLLLEAFGEGHPEVKAVRKRIELTKNFIRNQAAEMRDAKSNPELAPTDPLSLYLESVRQELDVNKLKYDRLQVLSEEERVAAKRLMESEVDDEALRNDIARTQQLFDGIIKRLSEINLVKDVGGLDIQVVSPAGIGEKVSPILLTVMLGSVVIGLVLGVGGAYALELADMSFRSPDDIRDQVGVPVVGHIPFILDREHEGVVEGSALDPVLCTFHRPRCHESEAYRAVRTAVYFNMRGKQHRIIQVSSPSPGDGKSTLCANLSISIAQSGRKILLIDADLRRPRVHKLFGIKPDVGLSSFIEGKAEFTDAIYPSGVDNLEIMPCGPMPKNPAELLTSPRFDELLQMLREKYDFVLIDSPPMLAVTDSSVVAARVDAVLLTMRLTKNCRHGLLHSTQMIDNIGAEILGIIVNFVGGTRRDAYLYGASYGYGSGRYYGKYGYGNKYEFKNYYAEAGGDQPHQLNGSAANETLPSA